MIDSQAILERAAKAIEPYVDGKFRIADRALGAAEDLHQAGLLAGQDKQTPLPVREAAVNVLQCRTSWSTAKRIVAQLAADGLLAAEAVTAR